MVQRWVLPEWSLRFAIEWTDRALFQGMRLTDLLGRQTSFDLNAPAERAAFLAENMLPTGEPVEALESYFFVVSVAHVATWLEELVVCEIATDAARQAVERFRTELPDAKLLRDNARARERIHRRWWPQVR